MSSAPRPKDAVNVGWPQWIDRLPARIGFELVEGGRRTNGRFRKGTADQPLVTYVTIVRNNASTLGRAIESVQDQTYPAIEHVILDGASTDATLEVIRTYEDRLDYFASEADDGLYAALNKAIPLARGDLICVLNSDDWLEPTAAEVAVARLKDATAPTLILTAANARQPQSGSADPAVLLEWHAAPVHAGCYFTCANDCHNGVYATRCVYERSGPYDASYAIAADFKWLMTCFDAGVDFVYSRAITVNYVLGGVSSDAERHGIECVRAMRERFPELTAEEAGGLHHSFFVFPTFSTVPGRPDDRSDFLCRLLARHSDDPELLSALATLLNGDEDSHSDEGAEHADSPAHTSVKERIKSVLENHPTMYETARRLYVGARRI